MVANAKRWLGSDPVELLVRIMVAVTVIVCLILFIRQNNLASCQYKYSQVYAEYVISTREIREADDKVLDELFRAIYEGRNLEDAEKGEKQIDAAFVKYFTTVELTSKDRFENPVPALPSTYCR